MGPVFHSHCSQMPLYSVPPPFIPPFDLPLFPPPINDPFVRVFLPRWAGGPQQGWAPRLSSNSFLLHSIICVFSAWLSLSFFSPFLVFITGFEFAPRDCFVAFALIHSSSQSSSSSDMEADRFFKFLPSLLFTTHSIVNMFFNWNLIFSSCKDTLQRNIFYKETILSSMQKRHKLKKIPKIRTEVSVLKSDGLVW